MAGNVLSSGTAVFRGMRIFMLCCGIRRLPRNLLLATKKCGIARFLLHLYLIQDFLGSFLLLPFMKQ